MVEPSKPRSHGQTGAEEEAFNRSKELDKLPDLPEDVPMSLTRAFQRMRLDWNSSDRPIIESVKQAVDDFIWDAFEDAFRIKYQIWDTVREKKINKQTGEIVTDDAGLAVWVQRPDGSYVEDWSKISSRVREDLLYEIMTRLFDWELRVAEIKSEALFAKALWEEAFAIGFDDASPDKKTVEARSARGTRVSMDQRFFGIFKSACYEKAQAIVRSMDRMAQRLKDIHTA